MRLTSAFMAILAITVLHPPAEGDTESIGQNGINSANLTLLNFGQTPLTGAGVGVGMVDGFRPGKHTDDGGPDDSAHSADLTIPDAVYDRTGNAQPNTWVNGHSQQVAGIIISSDTRAPGVAPAAKLHAASTMGPEQIDYADTAFALANRITSTGDRINAINMSVGLALDPFETVDGGSFLSRFVDWSAANQDVLYVVAGRELGAGLGPVPSDNYNGITVAFSARDPFGRFANVGADNVYTSDAIGDRVSVDLLAPGFGIDSITIGNGLANFGGTSAAAPHVTGAIALLQQYAKYQISENNWLGLSGRRHELMKAILLNSADKLIWVHGSNRTIFNLNSQSWPNTAAHANDGIPLDLHFGAGHLNVKSALHNLSGGKYDPGYVPPMGWDYGFVAEDSTNEYLFNNNFVESLVDQVWVAITLTWDRHVRTDQFGNAYNENAYFLDFPIEEELTNLDLYLLDDSNAVVARSTATADSVEHIFFDVGPNVGDGYKIRVVNAGGGPGGGQAYALAWWMGEFGTPIPGDFNEDGEVNGADLNEWKSNFALNAGADADLDGDSDGNDFLAWQIHLGIGAPAVPASTQIPEPRMGFVWLGTSMLFHFRRRRRETASPAALLVVAAAVTATLGRPACGAELSLVRNSRSITAAEVAGGAPAGSVVHDFYVTSDADLLSLETIMGLPLYNHRFGDNQSAPSPELVAELPALGADSFLRLPSSTLVLGGGFNGKPSVWGDLENDGPQSNFLFGRLTTTQAGAFTGTFAVRGEVNPITLPFTFLLPGPGESLLGSPSEQLFVAAEEWRPPPPAPPPIGPDFNQRTSADYRGGVSVELTRQSRPTNDVERRYGAPNGFVHEFFVTSATDVINVGNVAIDAPVHRHEHGSDIKPPNSRVLKLYPGITADSFVTTPGPTLVLGKGFYGTGDPEIVWYDETDDGPLDEFLFARLTTDETGSFSGEINVRGPGGAVSLPFNFVLPGNERDLALLAGEPTYRLHLSFDEAAAAIYEPAAVVPEPAAAIPEPAAAILVLAALALLRRK